MSKSHYKSLSDNETNCQILNNKTETNNLYVKY